MHICLLADPLEVDSSIYETFMESEKINVVDDDGSGGNVMSRPVITNVMSRPAVTNVKKNKSEQNARLRNVQCNITLESALSQVCFTMFYVDALYIEIIQQ